MLQSLDISVQAWLLGLCGAFALGVSKAGFPGLALINVVIMAELFGAKASVGLVLPLLIACDLIVYPLFRKHGSWREVWPLLWPTLVGVGVGTYLLEQMDDLVVRRVIGAVILTMLTLQWIRQRSGDLLDFLPDSIPFRCGSGLIIGISTMMANAAGPIYSIYGLVRKLSKEHFLGLGARFFLLVNVLKLPFGAHLGIISGRSLLIDLLFLPGILAGIFLGRSLLQRIPQRIFEILLFVFAAIAGLRLLLA